MHDAVDGVVANRPAAPALGHQIIARDDGAPGPGQHHENLHGARLERGPTAGPEGLAQGRGDVHGADSERRLVCELQSGVPVRKPSHA